MPNISKVEKFGQRILKVRLKKSKKKTGSKRPVPPF